VAKHRYKDVKHPDKFHEALSKAWAKAEPYALPAGIAVLALLVLTGVWVAVARQWTAGREEPWAELFRIQQEAELAQDRVQTEAQRQTATVEKLAALETLSRENAGRPVAAVALQRLASGYFALAEAERTREPDASKRHLVRAAEAAEQFLADFPDHGLAPLAAYTAGKARFELDQFNRALQHFQQAQTASVRAVAAFAQWHAARCQEELGQLAAARQAYQSLRNDPWAGWTAEQARWRLAQLDRQLSPDAP
jgi:tetratricopeptide (TPR) repeat protein